MKTKIYFAFVFTLLVFVASKSFSQTTNSTTAGVSVTEVTIMGGVMSLPSYGNSIAMFKKLAPTSEILGADLSNYKNSYEPSSHALGVFNANISLKFNGKDGMKNQNPLLRLGITYNGGQLLNKDISFESRTPYDTLVSTQTGEKIYIDSIYTSAIDMSYRTSQILADIAVLWRTNPELRWSLYGGVGFAGGISFNNRTTISRFESNSVSNSRDNYYPNETKSEVVLNENGYSALAYLPLGVGIEMGKSGFWKMLNLVVEMKPGISLISVPELETNVTAVFPVSFGFRVSW